ncbi:MAG: S-methyl-5'-thioinosine phosphorylase [Chloroflexota bacterium]|nr:S-methyl-5'-thioinosine phosphorylase [Chloroflexota bacterium]
MHGAIIGGTGFDRQLGARLLQEVVVTPYGVVPLYRGQGELAELIFLPRHGTNHTVPPHRINYRANLKALAQLGVERVLATFAVGSLHTGIPPGALVVLDQFIDFTQGRAGTFFDGGDSGLVHTEMTNPYCPALRAQLLALAAEHGLELVSQGTYVCTDGPRFETAAEVRMYAQLGGDVVGMTGVPEASLARELGLHYAAVALSINWGAGLEEKLEIVRGLEATERALLALFSAVLHQSPLPVKCNCKMAAHVIHPPVT